MSYAQPQNTKRVIRGYIEPGTVTPSDVGTVRFFYDSQLYVTFGSMMTLLNGIRACVRWASLALLALLLLLLAGARASAAGPPSSAAASASKAGPSSPSA